MISTPQPSFDFQGTTPAVLTVKPLRSVSQCSKDFLQELDAKLIGDSQLMRQWRFCLVYD